MFVVFKVVAVVCAMILVRVPPGATGCRNYVLGHRERTDTFLQFSAKLSIRQNITASDILTSLFDELTAASLPGQTLFDQLIRFIFVEQPIPIIYALNLTHVTSTSTTSSSSEREIMTGDGTAVSCLSTVMHTDHHLTMQFTYELAADLSGGDTMDLNCSMICHSICNSLNDIVSSTYGELVGTLGTLSTEYTDPNRASTFSSTYSLIDHAHASVGSSSTALIMVSDSLRVISRLHSPRDDLCFAVIGDWGKGGLTGDITNATQVALSQSSSSSNEKGGKGHGHNHKGDTFTYQNAVAKSLYVVANGYYDLFGIYNTSGRSVIASDSVSGSADTGVSNRNVNNNHNVDSLTLKPSFIAALGDNFYAYGVASVDDTQWESSWQNVYLTNPAFASNNRSNAMLNLSWFAIFGNHDYGYGSAGTAAQIQRTNSSFNFNGLWNFPAQFYARTYSLPQPRLFVLNNTNDSIVNTVTADSTFTLKWRQLTEQNASSTAVSVVPVHASSAHTVKIIYLDTTTLSPSMNKCCNSNGGISETLQATRIATQLAFVEQELQRAAGVYTWIIVAGHYPMFSTGGHGDGSELQAYLLPLLLKYGVHAYVNGHDHVSEHLYHNGIHYFTTGAGCMTDKVGETTSNADVLWSGGGFSAFSTVTASSSELCFTYVNITGHVVYNFTLQHPGLVNRQFVAQHSHRNNSIGSGSSGGSGYMGGGNGDGGPEEEQRIMLELFIIAALFTVLIVILILVCFLVFKDTGMAGGRHQLLSSSTAAAVDDVDDVDIDGDNKGYYGVNSSSTSSQFGRLCDALRRGTQEILGPSPIIARSAITSTVAVPVTSVGLSKRNNRCSGSSNKKSNDNPNSNNNLDTYPIADAAQVDVEMQLPHAATKDTSAM